MTPTEEKNSRLIREAIQEYIAAQPIPAIDQDRRKTNWLQLIGSCATICAVLITMAGIVFGLWGQSIISPLTNRVSLLERDQSYVANRLDNMSEENKEQFKVIKSEIKGMTSSLDRFLGAQKSASK